MKNLQEQFLDTLSDTDNRFNLILKIAQKGVSKKHLQEVKATEKVLPTIAVSEKTERKLRLEAYTNILK